MKTDRKVASNGLLLKLIHFIEKTDIRLLVYVLPIIGVAGFVVILFIASLIANGRPNEAFSHIALGVLSLIMLISGVAQIYKRELPGPFGTIIRGKLAVVSGAIYVVVFGIGSVTAFISGLSNLFSK